MAFGRLGAALLFGLCAWPGSGAGAISGTGEGGAIARVGFYHIGGERTPRGATGIMGDTPDVIRTHQLAVLELQPATETPGRPIVLLPGYGIAADTYLQTPDGREGWAMDFVRAGHPVYIVEPAHTTRSGIDTGFYRSDRGSDARELFSWGGESVWRRWGLGPEFGVAFEDSRFPYDHYSEVIASFTGVEAERLDGGSQIGFQVPANLRGLIALFERIGPAALVTHSASGVAAFAFASERPDLIDAVIAIEPVGCPEALAGLPVLALFGAHIEVREQIAVRQEECQMLIDAIVGSGGRAEMYALPAMGITGNSHLMMMEDNSQELFGLIAEWLVEIPAKQRQREAVE